MVRCILFCTYLFLLKCICELHETILFGLIHGKSIVLLLGLLFGDLDRIFSVYFLLNFVDWPLLCCDWPGAFKQVSLLVQIHSILRLFTDELLYEINFFALILRIYLWS